MKRSGPGRRTGSGGRISWLFLVVLAVSFAASAGVSYYLLKGKFTVESSFIEEIESRSGQPAGGEPQDAPSRLYEARGGEVTASGGAEAGRDNLLVAVEDVIRERLEPYDVRLLDLYVDKEGTVYMDLGEEITKNFRGDAAEEMDLIAGLYSGIRQTLPDLRKIKILVGGMEAESLGGHVNIAKPIGEEIAGKRQ